MDFNRVLEGYKAINFDQNDFKNPAMRFLKSRDISDKDLKRRVYNYLRLWLGPEYHGENFTPAPITRHQAREQALVPIEFQDIIMPNSEVVGSLIRNTVTQRLVISKANVLDSDIMRSLSKSPVRDLSIYHGTTIVGLFGSMPALRSLRLSTIPWYPVMRSIAALPNLDFLDLNQALTADEVKALSDSNIKVLRIDVGGPILARPMGSQAIRAISSMKNLEALKLWNGVYDVEQMRALGSLKLKHFEFYPQAWEIDLTPLRDMNVETMSVNTPITGELPRSLKKIIVSGWKTHASEIRKRYPHITVE